MSRPGDDIASGIYPEGRLYFQCGRCGRSSRRLDRFTEHLRTACYARELHAVEAVPAGEAEAVDRVWLTLAADAVTAPATRAARIARRAV